MNKFSTYILHMYICLRHSLFLAMYVCVCVSIYTNAIRQTRKKIFLKLFLNFLYLFLYKVSIWRAQ